MKIIFVQDRDTFIGLELSLRQAEMILDFLDHCQYDESKIDKEIVEYVKEDFFKGLDGICENVRKAKEL